MSFLIIKNIRIAGISACVPAAIEENRTLPIFKDDPSEAEKVIQATGIERKRIVEPGVTSSDLGVKALEPLLDALKWERSSVDCLIFVSITRDFIAPMTSCILQDRLGLSDECCVFDIPAGCAGWIYGMSVLSSLLSHGYFKRGILICAETNSLNRSSQDKTVKPLFGDAATVTALEYSEKEEHEFRFSFGVDGSGYQAIWAQYGGSRYPITPESLKEKEIEKGISRKGIDMVVNGMDVFSFAIKRPPIALQQMTEHFSIDINRIDYLFLHQANKYIIDRIRKKLRIPPEKVPLSLIDFGNTTGASIPLTMVTECGETLKNKTSECLACGFGIGLAWGSAHFFIDKPVCLPLILY